MASAVKTTLQPGNMLVIPPLTTEEEEALIHARITNDERPLRRLTRKFHTYTSVAYPPIVDPPPTTTSSVEEAREAFLIELASFQLFLRKSRMVCDAERRQVSVYRKEKLRISNEHAVLKNQIEELKSGLEQAQIERRRKIEYDQVAEKINALASREELELSISALENDMQVIRDENEAQSRTIYARKAALDSIVSDLAQLRILAKDKEALKLDTSGDSRGGSEAPSPAPGTSASGGVAMEVEGENGAATEGEGEKDAEGMAASSSSTYLNPTAKSFVPRQPTPLRQVAARNSASASGSGSNMGGMADTPGPSHAGTPMPTRGSSPAQDAPDSSSPLSQAEDDAAERSKREEGEEGEEVEEPEEGEEAEDIEMGEVSERETKSGGRGRKAVEDREDGEASDGLSELTELED